MIEPKTKPARRKTKDLPAGSSKPIQRILVVDDDPFFCHRNAEVLIRHGYQVNAAENAEVGWEELQLNHYNLLITESELPNLTGVQLIKKLRSARMTLPVIMATADLPPVPAARKIRLQPVVTLQKPYTIEEFISAVKIVLADNIPARKKIPPAKSPAVTARKSWLWGF